MGRKPLPKGEVKERLNIWVKSKYKEKLIKLIEKFLKEHET